ncbi:AarF/ABC1/UbiB kinase family protein [filamentous cyanobacterium LEGE 11480]|uniref:AarF/ABC1/UbiB kinase family protein n=1 Tax=Romeriopsis navalis LEGE 11480 TaxID=2777977 RepID=A0A928VPH3_9CYAN|nr:AarF/ABC1/UbiB kinase family protein [Romeriopsis navalis]MBE9030235.1 AarF/ABC1/UbiB kinase family protein [Romeriopsis navalis LEGE 11480]
MISRSSNLPFISSRQAEILEVVARNGWGWFRSQLSPSNNQETDEEFTLPLPSALRQILIDLGPTFVKLGQLLSTRPDLLSPDYIAALETLQDDVPPVSWSTIEKILQTDLAQPIDEIFAEIDKKPVAAGSLGQVHRAKLSSGEVVAIKVQRPGIRAMIERDLDVLQSIAEFFNGDRIGQAYDLIGLVEEFSNSILGELDFRREARNTDQLRTNLAQSKLWKPGQVIVPLVYRHITTERVLVMEWINGTKLTQLQLPPERQEEIAVLVVRVIMQQMFLDRIFHADPHPGNFLYVSGSNPNGDDDKIALLDCGMVAILDPRTQRIITDLLVGIVFEQPRQVAQAIRELGFARLDVDIRAIESEFDRLLRRFYTRPLEEINLAELLNAALKIPRDNKIQMPGAIGLFAKAIANIEGIARQLDPNFAFVEVARPVVTQALQKRVVGEQALPNVARSSLYFSQLLLDLPQRVDVLADRLERSELGLTLRWRDQNDFQKTVRKSTRRITLAVLSLGLMLTGGILTIADAVAKTPPKSDWLVIWHQSFLVAGMGLALWLITGLLVKP